MTALAVGLIAPHGDLAIADACDDATRGLAAATQAAMDHAAQEIARSDANCVVVATPHGVHVAGRFAVITAGSAAGRLDEAAAPLDLGISIDRSLAGQVAAAMDDAGLPVVEVSFGGNSADEAVMPLDWGSLVPLWHVRRWAPSLPAVIVSPARELDARAHVSAGAAIARAAGGSRRIAFIASADQGHGHHRDGPYGHHPESAEFDRRVVDIVGRNALEELLQISREDVSVALADSWWQMLMLLGALRENGTAYRCEVLAYEAPTYYGMLTALVTPCP